MGEVPERLNPFPGLRPFTEDEAYLFSAAKRKAPSCSDGSGRRAFWRSLGRRAAANPRWFWPGCSRRYTAV
jgi:hypothetical protein